MALDATACIFFKTAGAQSAYNALGFEKEAFGGAVVGALGRGVMGAGKALGKGIWGLGSKAYGSVANPLANVIGRTGQSGVNALQKAGLPQGAANWMQRAGKGIAKDMAGFGLLEGGIGAAMADPGDRLSGFGRGMLSGGLSGAAMGLGTNVARMGLKAGLGQQRWNNLMNAGKWRGGGIKGFGAKMLTSGVPVAAGTAASFMTPSLHQPQQQPPRYLTPAIYGGMHAMNTMAFHPGTLPRQRYY